MSKRPSSKRQKPSSGAGSDGDGSDAAPDLVSAGRLLTAAGACGFVWLDENLVALRRVGRLVDFVPLGLPLCRSVLALYGLDDEITAVRSDEGRTFYLPGIALVTTSGMGPRLNFTVLWSAGEERYLLVVVPVVQRPDLEQELSRQTRARLIAEEEVTAKSLELQRANTELARANADLEDYAGIISHDLQAPLRTMRYLSEDLARSIGEQAGEEAGRSITRMSELSRRMTAMLRALLDYSSIGRKRDAVEPVDTGRLVAAIVESLPRPKGIRIEIEGRWPELATIGALLDLVLRNLLANAIRHHDRRTGFVRIRAEEIEDAIEISVADDGPGIPEVHHRAVFLPFRTLDEPRQTQGRSQNHGMGLAFVRRAVDAIGGDIILESDPGTARGSTFRVRWPKHVAD